MSNWREKNEKIIRLGTTRENIIFSSKLVFLNHCSLLYNYLFEFCIVTNICFLKLPSNIHRDILLAGTQQSVELKLALDQEQQKSKKLEESMRKLDEEMRRTDELLYQMIPKMVADRLRRGENPIDTCEVRVT